MMKMVTYKYNGASWVKERNSQVYSIDVIGDGLTILQPFQTFYTHHIKRCYISL
jgi:cobalamin biosynthesis Co2+ chelatase CbiK